MIVETTGTEDHLHLPAGRVDITHLIEEAGTAILVLHHPGAISDPMMTMRAHLPLKVLLLLSLVEA